jgi:chromosome segregation protein
MLRIEKVFLQGFKSFYDPTELVFDTEGITAVVGPNGCGKSNIADALSWVIGEQRAKVLRGGKMEDVIFQGSRNHAPSGMAEVVLTLRVYESFEIRLPPPPSVPSSAQTPTNSTREDSAPVSSPPLSAETTPKSINPLQRAFQAGERITIARRLYRTGESEYEMNGKTSRLRDIQDLFAGTGLGGAHYAIIEQGRIGQVLSAKPMDRRALIEEAAGVSKFKLRQRASELKLEAAQHNLARVSDIIAEVERQVGALKRHAARSRRYQRLRQEMRELMRAVFIADYRVTAQKIQELEAKLLSTDQSENHLKAQIAAMDRSRQQAVAHLEQLESSLAGAHAATAQANLQVEKTRQQMAYWQEQSQSLEARAAQFSRDQAAIRERERLITQEIARLNAEVKLTSEEIDAEACSLSQLETLFQQQLIQDNQLESELEQSQRLVTEAATQRERWSQLVRQFQEAVARCEQSIAGLTSEQQRTAEQARLFSQEEFEISQIHTAQLAQQAELKAHRSFTITLQQAKTQEIIQLEEQLKRQQKDLISLDQRLKSLKELDERRANYSEPVQAIMQAVRDNSPIINFNIIGTLADYIKVSPQDEEIIEIGLREELQYLIAPTFEDALEAISFLKREKLGRATFLVLHSKPLPRPLPEPAAALPLIRLIDLLGLKPELQIIIQQALPRLTQTVITNEINQAISDSISSNGKGHSFLTSSGEFISAGHIISGGSMAEQQTGILALKREIKSLQNEVEQLDLHVAQTEQQYQVLKAEGEQYALQLADLDARLQEVDKILALNQGQKEQVTREQERTATHLRVIEKEIKQAQQERLEYGNKLQHAESEWNLAQEQLLAAQNRTAETQEIVAATRRKAAERNQELSRRRADFAAKSERRKGLLNDLKRLENEAQDIHNRLSRSQMEAIETKECQESLAQSLANAESEVKVLMLQWQEKTAAVEKLQMETSAAKESLQTHENQLKQLRDSLLNLHENRTALEVTRAKLFAHLEHIAHTCVTELGESLPELAAKDGPTNAQTMPPSVGNGETLSLTEFEEDEELFSYQLPTAFDLEAAQNRLQELRQKIDAMGPVNLLALEELTEAEQRLVFLLEQKTDIERAVADTLSVIAELKRRSREQFLLVFHEINQNFTEMFLELFGGGHGEMRLIDESDALESGIDIIAQPPGKRLQNVLLLSGGEKAMAALALIMGIFKFRPSPFCLLDEVDAPLDDVNISRFADKILEMSSQTQFLVITHSKRTMEAAKSLYGVTMQDPGVSKLISVRLT